MRALTEASQIASIQFSGSSVTSHFLALTIMGPAAESMCRNARAITTKSYSTESPRNGEIAEKGLLREYSCSESLHQAHLKSLRFTGLTQGSSEATCRDHTVQEVSTPREPTLLPRTSGSRNYQPLESEQAYQMTKDLCDNFQRSGDGPTRTELHPWKKTRMTPFGQILDSSRQSRDEVPVATIPVHRQGNYSPEKVPAAGHNTNDYLELKVGYGGCEVPNRWGVKRKVDAVIGTYSDHNDRYLREKGNDSYLRRVLSNEMDVGQLVPLNFMRGQWVPPSPTVAEAYPTPPKLNDLYGLQACSARGFFKRSAPCHAGKDPKSSFKVHQSRATTNMLKLPKDMQGRWSSERYKSAQLKLIDIMHGRRAQPGRPILRPALREEARKHIGDTGLLDHLLKHMTDTVVSTGERFRRRHNAEGAMEYWLEDASLMEIRKAAGIEDPSWLPPQGWKPGDKVLGGLWEVGIGMSSSEVAEMSLLKDTVEFLKREMKFLFERLKELKQMGNQQVVNLKDADSVGPRQTAHNAPWRSYDELDKKLEEHHAEQVTAAGSTNNLESQLADLRKSVSRIQWDVQCILKLLSSQHGHGRITSARDSPQAEGFGNGMPGSSLQSTGEEVLSATNASETLNPASSSRGLVNNAHHVEPLARELASVNSATSSSTDADGPSTKEIYCVTERPECQVKMGESSVPRVGSRPQEADNAVWLNLAPKTSNQAINTRWDDCVNPSHRDQYGICASTTNSQAQINFPGVVSTLKKDNCPVAAAMAGMFGCMKQANHHHPIKGQNPNYAGTDFLHPQLRLTMADGLMIEDYSTTSARKSENCIGGHDPKLLPARFERAFGDARQAMITLKPSDNNSASSHLGTPLSLSLSLTLGSPVHSEIADTIVKHS